MTELEALVCSDDKETAVIITQCIVRHFQEMFLKRHRRPPTELETWSFVIGWTQGVEDLAAADSIVDKLDPWKASERIDVPQ